MKYFLGILGVVFVAIIALVLITSGGGGDKRPAVKKLVVAEEAREGVSAVYTVQGAVTGENQRRAIRIIVNQDERRLEILSGYGEAVERASTFPNTNTAFENFLVALDQAGFDNKRLTNIEDERGTCPLGRRFIYELREYSQEMFRLWNTSCGGKLGDFSGRSSTVRRLFELQIPDYNRLVRGVDLTGRVIKDK